MKIESFNECCVYWIHYPSMTDIKTQGYVGITKDKDIRFKSHINEAKRGFQYKREEFKEALLCNEVVITVIFQGEREACLELEAQLRPFSHVGWNVAKGGGSSKQLKGTEYYSNYLSKWGTISEWASYANLPFEQIRSKLRSSNPQTIDQILNFEKAPVVKRQHYKYSIYDEEAILYYLDYTAMTEAVITKKVIGRRCSFRDLMLSYKVPEWQTKYVDIEMDSGITVRIKRRIAITDVWEINKIHNMYFYDDLSKEDIVRRCGYSRNTVIRLIREMEEFYE